MNDKDKAWGKKLTGGLICLALFREIAIVVSSDKIKLAIAGMGMIVALAFMVIQHFSDRKPK